MIMRVDVAHRKAAMMSHELSIHTEVREDRIDITPFSVRPLPPCGPTVRRSRLEPSNVLSIVCAPF